MTRRAIVLPPVEPSPQFVKRMDARFYRAGYEAALRDHAEHDDEHREAFAEGYRDACSKAAEDAA